MYLLVLISEEIDLAASKEIVLITEEIVLLSEEIVLIFEEVDYLPDEFPCS